MVKDTFFPISNSQKSNEDFELCKKWLHAIGTTKFDINHYKYHRDRVVCHKHFSADCFEEDLKAKLTGSKPRKLLKYGSVPTIFAFREPQAKRKRTEQRLQEKQKKQMIESVIPEKRPKKCFKVKKAHVDLLPIPEEDIPVGASQEITEEVTVHENLRRVVKRYTCMVKDVGTQVDVPMTTASSQTFSEFSEVIEEDHDYFGFLPQRDACNLKLDDASVLGSPTFSLIADMEEVAKSNDFLDDVAMWMSVFYILNIEYPASLHKTLTFLQKVILNIQDNLPVLKPVVTLTNKLDIESTHT